jgi:hypothetical protein
MARLLFLMTFIISSLCQGQQYSAALIPDSLVKNARVVKRFDETIMEIKSPRIATLREHTVYTILNESGEEFARYKSYYDKFTSINSISGILYNSAGKEIRHVKKKEMMDVAGTDDETLISDTRYKINNFYFKDYPFTVEYDEEDDVDGIRNFPHWQPQNDTYLSVEFSRYVIIAPKDYDVRYMSFHFNTSPVISESSNKKTYTWEIRNLPARLPENLSPSWVNMAPCVMIAPSQFEAEGYKGDMSTWGDFGKFIYQLIQGKDELPADIKARVHQMTDGITDPKQKVAVLYDFLQKNTRYISVQLGIGGWRPFDASYVATKRYGDCKALSNYMIALLKEAGITGKYVLIRALKGAAPIITDFPESQFNHAICCVPLGKDTVWLECTSESLPAGYLSGFTADRYGLLVDETGGKLVHTPKYGLKDNLLTRKISASLDLEGLLSATVHARYSGMQQDELEGLINAYTKDRVLKYLKTQINLPTYDVSKFDYQQEKAMIPSINEHLEITASNYAQVSGKRLFVRPNILNRFNTRLENADGRKNGFVLTYEYRDLDTVELKIPPGYTPESVPKDVAIENKFGSYHCAVKVSPEKITYYRLNETYAGEFPAQDYAALVKYYDDMYRSDQSQVVLVKKE